MEIKMETVKEFLERIADQGVMRYKAGWFITVNKRYLSPNEDDFIYHASFHIHIPEYDDFLSIGMELTGEEEDDLIMERLAQTVEEAMKFKKQQHMN